MYVDTQDSLRELIQTCTGAATLAIDTEFLREDTYFPQLCLIQVATDDCQAVIDPLAGLDLSILTPLMTDERTVKVFHAGDQDRQILFQALGVAARPVFDTQHAALLLGLPQQMSLAALVKHYAKVELKKKDSFSDWAQRPLSQAQLTYAIDDVRYLSSIYETMVSTLTASGRLEWLAEDFAAMGEDAGYAAIPGDLWKKVKGTAGLKGRQLAVAREIAIWRDNAARAKDLPRKWILSDDLLVEIVKLEPGTIDELWRIRGLKNRLKHVWSQEIIKTVEAAKRLPQEAWPTREHTRAKDPAAVGRVDLMTTLVHQRARELHIAGAYLASHDDLSALAVGHREDLAVLKGWRRELVGNELLQLLDGRIGLSLNEGELKVTFLPQAGSEPAH